MAIDLSKETPSRGSFIIPITLILVGYISYTHSYNQIASDMSLYMTYALNIFNGNGYIDMNGSPVFFRGPVFPLMIAASFKLFGVKGLSAIGVVKLFCILNPVVLYYLGKRLFSEKIGIASALLVLSSYSISFWSFQFIDAVWPFFVLLHCYFLFAGLEQNKNKTLCYVLSGLFLGVAILTKEVSILFLPIGLLMFGWVKEYRYRGNFLGVCASLFITLIILLPWLIYLFRHAGLSFLIGTAGPVVAENITNTLNGNDTGEQYNALISLLASLKHFIFSFVYFYSGQTNTVSTNFTIAPLFLISWPMVFFYAISGHKGSKLLFLGLLLFSPIIFFIGKNHWRFGQVLISMFFSYIALSYSVFCIVGWIGKRIQFPSFIVSSGYYIFILAIVIMQIFAQKEKDLGFVNFFQKTTLYHYITEKKHINPEVTGFFVNPYLMEIINILRQLPHDHGGIAGGNYFLSRNVFFHLGGEKKIHAFPMIWRTINQEYLGMPPENNHEKPLYVSSLLSPLEPQFRLYLLFESQFVDFIHTNQIEYLILSPLFRSLSRYFNNSDMFELIFQASPPGDNNEVYSLYRVKEGVKYDGLTPTIFSDEVVIGLNELLDKDSKRFDQVHELIFYRDCSFTKNDVDLMLNSKVKIPRFHADQGEKYYDEGDLQQAIILYQEAIRLDPENVRYHCRLGDLYEKSEQFSLALQQYQKAYQLDPDNSGIIYHLGTLYLKNDQLDRAIEQLQEAVKLEPYNSGYNYLLGTVYKEAGFLEEAYAQLVKASSRNPDKSFYYWSLGDLYRQEGKLDEAITQYQIAVNLEPNNPAHHNLLGKVYQEAGLFEYAQREFKTAIRLYPENAAYRRFLGDLYKQSGRLKKAIRQYRKAVILDPENSAYYYLLGSAFQAAGFHEKAHEQFEIAVRLDPLNAWYHRFLGQSHELAGRPEMALEQYQLAVRLDPTITSFHYLLGNLYQKIGRSQEALQQYEELLHLEPVNPQYQKLVEQFDADQASPVQ
jgi:tetratricopeptide (TPR) repeat protein